MFLSKSKEKSGLDYIYIEMTRTYLGGLSDILEAEDLMRYQESPYLISEGYRNALCLLLSLKTEASTYLVKKYEEQFVDLLRPVYLKYNLYRYSQSERRGILEACVHCIEKSRKLVNGK